jgi:hypothetical protein
MGALTENHRCPRSTWIHRISDALLTVMIGSVVGGLVVFEFVEHPTGALVLASAALGAVLAGAVRQAVGGPKF